jgi:hypothetical protein
MNVKKALVFVVCVLFVVSCFAQMQMPKGKPTPRDKTEMKAGGGSIVIEYGRPTINGINLKGSDPMSQFPVGGKPWRMGANQATVITTPVDLSFGSTKIAKGSYSLFLGRPEAEKFELIFNSQTGQWGLSQDPSKDVAKVSMKKEALQAPVDPFTIELKPAPKGGVFVLSWGTTQLSAEFQFAQ